MPSDAGPSRALLTPRIHQGLAHRGASEGGPRLSAPTDPRRPRVFFLSESRTRASRPSAGSDRDAPRRPLFCETGTRGQHSPRQAAPAPRKHALSQEAALQRPARPCLPGRPGLLPGPGHPAHARTCTRAHARAPSQTYTARTHRNTLAAGIHAPATPAHSRVELLTPTRRCWEGVPARLQSLRDPRRPGFSPGGVKDPEGCGGGGEWPPGFPRGQLPISGS